MNFIVEKLNIFRRISRVVVRHLSVLLEIAIIKIHWISAFYHTKKITSSTDSTEIFKNMFYTENLWTTASVYWRYHWI